MHQLKQPRKQQQKQLWDLHVRALLLVLDHSLLESVP
jgi:hypothetical protein